MKHIFSGLAPNMRKGEAMKAINQLLPWSWTSLYTGSYPKQVEQHFETEFGGHAVCFDSGRTALQLLLEAYGIGEGDEVLVQAYTCMVVINAIRFTGARPVFLDIDNSLNIVPEKIEERITKDCKAIIIQHTFGNIAQTKEIVQISKAHKLIVIEDCAHIIEDEPEHTTKNADASFFSFGSWKSISSVRGGLALTKDAKIVETLRQKQEHLPRMSFIQLKKHLLYYPIFAIGKKLYNVFVGKLILFLSKKLHLTPTFLEKAEWEGNPSRHYPSKYPNALAKLAFSQLSHLAKRNAHRRKIAVIYKKQLPKDMHFATHGGMIPLSYPIHVSDPYMLAAFAKQQNMQLDTSWTGATIVPKGIHEKATAYKKGTSGQAEQIVKHIITLPTHEHITEDDAARICTFILALQQHD